MADISKIQEEQRLSQFSETMERGVQSEKVIVARDLAVQFGRRMVWRDAGFEIERGEFITVVGPNGAGKSTLLRLLLGLLPASYGEIQVLGAVPRRGNAAIGYVPQRRTLDPDLAVRARDFVTLGLDGHRWGVPLLSVFRRRQQEAVQTALEAVGAAAYAQRRVGQLSGGEQQRLLLAQALLGRPALLLLDEPLASLDLRNQGAIAQLVARIARERAITVLLVAHDINPLLPFTQRVLYIAGGKVAIGKPEEIITSEHLSRLYDAPVEVMRDSRGRILVFGLASTAAYPEAV